MSLSGQLPLTAFFGSAPAQSRSAKPNAFKPATKRKDISAPTPPKKKQKYKENHASTAGGSTRESNHLSEKRGGNVHRKIGPLRPDPSAVRDEDIIDLTDTTLPVNKAPSTPTPHNRDRRLTAAASLPSPPLTAPDAKRPRKPRDVINTTRLPATSDPHIADPALTGATDTAVVGNKDAIVLLSPHKGGKTSMPPPSLPRKANPSAMPSRRAFRSPPSRSSDDWVPSSQPHETSIPRPERANDTEASGSVPCTPVDQSSQIVPSSQSNERELRIPEGQPTISDIPRVPAAALSHDSFFPLSMTDSEDRHSPSQDGFTGEFPSPTFVESSQSQYEHDLTASHAEMIDARRTALLWGKEAEPASIPSSSPPRPVESQDYYANDEYSQSQDTCSQPSTFGSSQPPASSSRISSQSGTYDEMSYPQTPSQLRHFTDMFLNRDEFGNELPQSGAEGGGSTTRPRSVSPSPTSRKKPRLEDPRGESSLTFSPQQRISPSPSHAHPGHGLRVHHRERSSGHGDDMLGELSTSHPTSQSFMDELEDDSSSQELPSAMQDFLAMFDGSQPSQVAHL